METSKLNYTLFGVLFSFLAFSFFVIVLLATMQPLNSFMTTFTVTDTIMVALMLIIFTEAGLLFVRRGLDMSEKNVTVIDKTPWSELATIARGIGIVKFALSFIIFAGLIYLVSKNAVMTIVSGNGVVTTATYIIAGTSLAYLIIRPLVRKLFHSIGVRANKMWATQMPHYLLEKDAVTIDLAIKQIGGPDKKFMLTIPFKDLDEIRVLSFPEAQMYFSNMGSDVPFAVASITDLFTYLQGKRERPRAYEHIQSTGTTILLHGSELLYLITFPTDGRDLLTAFDAYKGNKTVDADISAGLVVKENFAKSMRAPKKVIKKKAKKTVKKVKKVTKKPIAKKTKKVAKPKRSAKKQVKKKAGKKKK